MAQSVGRSVGEQISVLVKLQDLDRKIYALRATLAEKPREEARLKGAHGEREAALQAHLDELKRLQTGHKQRELELGTREQEVRKLQGQLVQVKTNREYTALQKEIDGRTADNSIVETELIRLLETIDQTKVRVEQMKAEVAVAAAHLADTLRRLAAERQAAEADLDAQRGRRAGLTSLVDRALLARYERILENRQGEALVAVAQGACGGCHLNLPPQTVAEVKLRQQVVACESCGRLLYEAEGA